MTVKELKQLKFDLLQQLNYRLKNPTLSTDRKETFLKELEKLLITIKD